MSAALRAPERDKWGSLGAVSTIPRDTLARSPIGLWRRVRGTDRARSSGERLQACRTPAEG